jgi:hypothetical protein
LKSSTTRPAPWTKALETSSEGSGRELIGRRL